jgi:F-type H+-transporting ATPase subunit delta
LSSVARRYAAALADVALAQGEAREVQAELLSWEKMIASSDLLQELLSNPTIPTDEKERAVSDLIVRSKVRQTTANLLRLLLKNQRLGELAEINGRFAEILDERAGLVSAEVVSARPVPESMKKTIQKDLRKITGREVKIDFTIDENLIGGTITKIGSTVYDGSIKNQLFELEKRLTSS